METLPNPIGGELSRAQSGETLLALNPATGETIARIPRCGASDVDDAILVESRAIDRT